MPPPLLPRVFRRSLRGLFFTISGSFSITDSSRANFAAKPRMDIRRFTLIDGEKRERNVRVDGHARCVRLAAPIPTDCKLDNNCSICEKSSERDFLCDCKFTMIGEFERQRKLIVFKTKNNYQKVSKETKRPYMREAEEREIFKEILIKSVSREQKSKKQSQIVGKRNSLAAK